MSIYILLEYCTVCNKENLEITKEGLYKFKKTWR